MYLDESYMYLDPQVHTPSMYLGAEYVLGAILGSSTYSEYVHVLGPTQKKYADDSDRDRPHRRRLA